MFTSRWFIANKLCPLTVHVGALLLRYQNRRLQFLWKRPSI